MADATDMRSASKLLSKPYEWRGAFASVLPAMLDAEAKRKQVEFVAAVKSVVDKILEARDYRAEARALEKRVDDYLNGRLDSLGKPSWSNIPYTPGEIMIQAKHRYDTANAIESELYDP